MLNQSNYHSETSFHNLPVDTTLQKESISDKNLIKFAENIIVNRKPSIDYRLNHMKWCLENQNYVDFNSAPFASDEYDNIDPDTYDLPLWFAYMNYRSDIVQRMLEKGYYADTRENFYQKRTLLHLAAFRHDKHMCTMLIYFGANIHAKNSLRESPIDHAGYTKDMHLGTILGLSINFSEHEIKSFQKYMINLYFKRNPR
jgi:ankyrin repeat protein